MCEVHYNTPAGFPQSFRKFFKFQVLKPLDVKTKFYNAETDEVYLEAQIQNITAGPICLEKVELDSSEQYTGTRESYTESSGLLIGQICSFISQHASQWRVCVQGEEHASTQKQLPVPLLYKGKHLFLVEHFHL